MVFLRSARSSPAGRCLIERPRCMGHRSESCSRSRAEHLGVAAASPSSVNACDRQPDARGERPPLLPAIGISPSFFLLLVQSLLGRLGNLFAETLGKVIAHEAVFLA